MNTVRLKLKLKPEVYSVTLDKINEWLIEASFHQDWDLQEKCQGLYDYMSSNLVSNDDFYSVELTLQQSVFLNLLLANAVYQQKFVL